MRAIFNARTFSMGTSLKVPFIPRRIRCLAFKAFIRCPALVCGDSVIVCLDFVTAPTNFERDICRQADGCGWLCVFECGWKSHWPNQHDGRKQTNDREEQSRSD